MAAVALYLPRGEQIGRPAVGGPFQLVSQDGAIFDSARLNGKPYALFFGYTQCPDVCPTTLTDMAELLAELGPVARDFRILFVTIDPERDTPQVLRDYLASFEPHVTGLTGSAQQIADVAKSFRVYYKKVPLAGGGYTMDHTAIVYLMNAKGEFAGALSYQEDHALALKKMRRLLAGDAG